MATDDEVVGDDDGDDGDDEHGDDDDDDGGDKGDGGNDNDDDDGDDFSQPPLWLDSDIRTLRRGPGTSLCRPYRFQSPGLVPGWTPI